MKEEPKKYKAKFLRKRKPESVVRSCLDGPSNPEDAAQISSSEIIDEVKKGFVVQEICELQYGLDVPMEKLVPMLGISKATYHRRKAAGRLDASESDRVVRFARLLGLATEVMESVENARAWLSSAQVGLGGAVPLEYAGTEVGAREVEDLLGRIDYGIYS